jgi:heme-degrading monooxygenase HmoA
MQTPVSEADKKSFERLFEKMGKDLETMEGLWNSEDYMQVLDCMMRRERKKQK